jgi:serine O-acetyltransferase
MLSHLRNYRNYDPAARSLIEVALLYPGPKAMFLYRIANFLFQSKIPFFPRLISEIARFLTGIEIHPGAKIGKNLIIDHGMGVVIGETAVIGNNVLLYHGVTLGAVVNKSKNGKRHPTLEDNVLVGAGASIVGAIVVGHGAKIGTNSVVFRDVPSKITMIGNPGKVVTNIKQSEPTPPIYFVKR